jgi:hypothetical protein
VIIFNPHLFQIVQTGAIPKMKPMLSVSAYVNIVSGHIGDRISRLGIAIRERRSGRNSHVQSLVCVSSCLLVMLSPAFATTIIGFRTVNGIVVGSDSREIDGIRILPTLACKIQSIDGRRFWASSGVYKESVSMFDVEAFVTSLAGNLSIREWVAIFEKRIPGELRRVLDSVKTSNPRSYRNDYLGQHVLEIVFFGWEDGAPTLVYRDYSTNAGGKLLEPTKGDCPGPKCIGPLQFCLGGCSEFKRMKEREKDWERGGLIPAVRRFINAEINANWQVGPPIDILQIDKSGPRWIGQDPQSKCPPIAP